MKTVTLLAVSGSLRTSSSNTALLQAIGNMLPSFVHWQVYDSLESIPAFNPDKDGQGNSAAPAVAAFRAAIAAADAILICTPEYAFGIPGALKNALDWTVSSGSLNEKPVAAISASPLPTGGNHALAALLLTLKALGAVTTNTALSIPTVNKVCSGEGELKDDAVAGNLQAVLEHLLQAIDNKPEAD